MKPHNRRSDMEPTRGFEPLTARLQVVSRRIRLVRRNGHSCADLRFHARVSDGWSGRIRPVPCLRLAILQRTAPPAACLDEAVQTP